MSIAIEKKLVDRPAPIVLHVPIEEEIVLADDVKVPSGIVDLATFREWADSADFPEGYRIEYSNGVIVVDLRMDQIYDHNGIKLAIVLTLAPLVRRLKLGRVFTDGARVSMPNVDASREPDAQFVSFASLRSGRIRKIAGRRRGVAEFEGALDMALEVVSDSSVGKDFRELPDQYFQAGVLEYWRVDPRNEPFVFEILAAGDDGFVPTERKEGWLWSKVFGHWFKLVQIADEEGDPDFDLLAKEQV